MIEGSRGTARGADKTASEARSRPDLLDEKSPPGLEVVQLTTDASVPASHLHPFLSPDGTMAFFNSDESGILQAYMIRGLENC